MGIVTIQMHITLIKGLKSVVNNDLLQTPFSGNCETDESQFHDLTSSCEADFPSPPSDSNSDMEVVFSDNFPVEEVNGLVYLVGWTCKTFLKKHDCVICKGFLLDSQQELDKINKIFCHFKAENNS